MWNSLKTFCFAVFTLFNLRRDTAKISLAKLFLLLFSENVLLVIELFIRSSITTSWMSTRFKERSDTDVKYGRKQIFTQHPYFPFCGRENQQELPVESERATGKPSEKSIFNVEIVEHFWLEDEKKKKPRQKLLGSSKHVSLIFVHFMRMTSTPIIFYLLNFHFNREAMNNVCLFVGTSLLWHIA